MIRLAVVDLIDERGVWGFDFAILEDKSKFRMVVEIRCVREEEGGRDVDFGGG